MLTHYVQLEGLYCVTLFYAFALINYIELHVSR